MFDDLINFQSVTGRYVRLFLWDLSGIMGKLRCIRSCPPSDSPACAYGTLR